MSSQFKCTTCDISGSGESLMKHLTSARHKTVMDNRTHELVACEECSNNNIHQLQIIRFGGDDMVLLCDPCFKKLYAGVTRPTSAYSLSNGAILMYWNRYITVRDCKCEQCGKDNHLNVDPSSKVYCDDCLKTKKNSKNYVSEDSGKFLYLLLNIKEPKGTSNSGKNNKRFTRRKGRSTKKGKSSKSRGTGGVRNNDTSNSNPKTRSSTRSSSKPPTNDGNSNPPKGVLKKIDAVAYQNRKDNTKIESNTRLNLRSFSGFKAVTSDTNLAATLEQNVEKNISRNQSSSNLAVGGNNNSHRQMGMNISLLNKPGDLMRALSSTDLVGKGKKQTQKKDNNKALNDNSKKKKEEKVKKTKDRKRQKEPTAIANASPSWDNSNGWGPASWDASLVSSFSKENVPISKSKNDKGPQSKKEVTPTPPKFEKSNKTTIKEIEPAEEGVQIRKFNRFTPKLTFPDLTTYLDTFSQAMFLEQKLENEFLEDFEISWSKNSKEPVFLVEFKTKGNDELKRLIMPHLVGKTNNPFNERQPLMLTTIDESLVWYTFVKEVREERNRIKLLLELFPWNKMSLPSRLGSEHLKLLPVSAQANRIMFAMTRITNPKFINLLLGNKKLKPIYFNNRLKFSRSSLNKSQRDAIEYVLNNSVTLIQGPPGTGKTSTIEELIHQIITSFHSFPILCVAASNIAIDNIAEKFVDNTKGIKVLRIVSDRKESEYNKSHPLGKICLHNIVYDMLPGDLRREEDLLRSRGKSAVSPKIEKKLFLAKSALVTKIIAQAQIICTTNITAGGRQLKSIKEIPTVIMDESTQSSEASTLVPLSLPGIKSFLFVGDEKQLSSFSNIPQLEMSLFERILLNGTCGDPQMLDTQYRMHPKISEFSIKRVYNDKLLNGVTEEQKKWTGIKYPLFFYQCDYGYEERAYSGGSGSGSGGFSYNNRYECEAILDIIYKLIKEKNIQLGNIGIITAYSAQRDLLSEILLNDPIINPRKQAMVRETDEDEYLNKNSYPGQNLQSHIVNIVNKLQIATVDSFQGHEKEFIIFSCVRNNADNKIGFLSDKRRLNVALTRAKWFNYSW